MRTIGLAAILALTSTAAFAGSFQFSIGGHNARIDFDESCTDRLCASVSWQGQGSSERTRIRLPEVSARTISKYIDVPKPHWNSAVDDNADGAEPAQPSARSSAKTAPSAKAAARPAPAEGNDDAGPAGGPAAQTAQDDPAAKAGRDEQAPPSQADQEPQAPAAQAAPRPAGRLGRPFGVAPRVKPPVAAATAPADAPPTANEQAANQPAAGKPAAPDAGQDAAPQETKVASVAPRQAPASAKPGRPSPVGEWLVEDGEGKIRIEPCGDNLCGVVSGAQDPDAKDRHNPNPALRNRPVLGTPILINMAPDGRRWSGRIYNVKDGRSYTAHISLRSADTLRVEGCAFGGMICGGQNWTRVN